MKLLYVNGSEVGQTFDSVKDSVSVGRETDNDVIILAGGLSRYHALFSRTDGIWKIRDLGSTNGTKLNGKPISTEPVPIENNDLCALGDQIFRVLLDESEQASGPTPASTVIPLIPNISEEIKPPLAAPVMSATAPLASSAVTPAIASEVTPLLDLSQSEPQVAPEMKSPSAVIPLLNLGDTISAQGHSNPSASPETNQTGETAFDLNTLRSQGIFAEKTTDDVSVNPDAADPKVKRKNLILIALVTVLAVLILSLIVILIDPNTHKNKPSDLLVENKTKQTTIYYERQIFTETNIYRMSFYLSQSNIATLRIYDLSTKRKVNETLELSCVDTERKNDPIWEVRQSALKQMLRDIELSKFMEEKVQETTITSPGYCVCSIFDGERIKKFSSESGDLTELPTFIKDIDDAIGAFCVTVFEQPFVATADDIFKQINTSYDVGINAYENLEASPENYRIAMKSFRTVITLGESFSPRPKQYTLALQRLKEVEDKRDLKIKSLRDWVFEAAARQSFKDALSRQKDLLDFFDPNSTDPKERDAYEREKRNYNKILKQVEAKGLHK